MQADLEGILVKLVYKSLSTVGKLQGYCSDTLGSADSEYHTR